jgi:hypothetical protein
MAPHLWWFKQLCAQLCQLRFQLSQMILCSGQPNLNIPWANMTSVRYSKLKSFQPEKVFSTMLHEQHVKGNFVVKISRRKDAQGIWELKLMVSVCQTSPMH